MSVLTVAHFIHYKYKVSYRGKIIFKCIDHSPGVQLMFNLIKLIKETLWEKMLYLRIIPS